MPSLKEQMRRIKDQKTLDAVITDIPEEEPEPEEVEEMFDEEPVEEIKEKTAPKKKPPKKKPAKKKPAKKKPVKKKPKEVIDITNEVIEDNPEMTTALVVSENNKNALEMPTRAQIDQHVEMYNYVKKKVVDEKDFISVRGKKFLKKSGVRKFIPAFNLSVKLGKTDVYELEINGKKDLHATATAIVTKPNGQSVEGRGTKSMSELHEKSLHNLTATAETRAINRAIMDLVAFGEVSAEEMTGKRSSAKEGETPTDEMF